MNVWEISLDNDQWLAFKRTAAVLYKLFIGLFVSPIPSHPVSHSDRKDNSSWCPTEDVLQYTNTKSTNTKNHKRYTLFVVTCLSIICMVSWSLQKSKCQYRDQLPQFKCQRPIKVVNFQYFLTSRQQLSQYVLAGKLVQANRWKATDKK